MIFCLLIAFAACAPPGYGGPYYGQGYGYAQGGSYAYAQSGYYQPPPQVIYVPAQPVYIQQPIYGYQQQYYGGGGGYGGAYPFGGGGLSVAVGPRGGVRVAVGR